MLPLDLSKTAPLQETLAALRKRHVAVVYQYLPPDRSDDVWYHVWGLGVMSFYGYGFEALGMPVKYVDVGSFVRSDHREAHYVLNLICGNHDVSHWGLVPSVASWRNAIPLPATADALIASERKDISSLFARKVGLACPQEYSFEQVIALRDELVVAKPRDYGSSKGLLIAPPATVTQNALLHRTPYIFQQFVPGIDVTVALIYDPFLGRHTAGHAIGYVSNSADLRWTFDDRAKTQHREGRNLDEVRKVFFDLPATLVSKAIELIARLGGSSLARVDFRVAAVDEASLRAASPEAYSFLEINLCPTISAKSNFVASLRRSLERQSYSATQQHREFFSSFPSDTTLNAFIVYSMASYGDLTSRCSGQPGTASFDG